MRACVIALVFMALAVGAQAGDNPAANPCIEITKAVNCDISKVGDGVVYTICVTNCGDVDLFNIVVDDDMLGDLSSLFSSTLLIGDTECQDVPYTIQPGDDNGMNYPDAVVVNTVLASGEDAFGNSTSDTSVEQVYLIHPSITVTMTCLTPLVPPGANAEFEITITNTGDCDLDVTTSAPGIGPLTIGAGDTYVEVESVPNPGGVTDICNDIYVTATIPTVYCSLPNVYNAYAEDCCPCAPDVEIIVTKIANCDISKVGDVVEYTTCITNASSYTDLHNITVVDDVIGDLSSHFPTSLLAGHTDCAVIPYTIQPGDDNGMNYPDAVVVNTVLASGEDAFGNPTSDTAVEQVYLIHPGLEVTKTCLTPLVPPGVDAEFEITITNTGDCDLDVTTSAPGIGPFTLGVGDTHVDVETEPNPGGVTEICNDIYVTATIPTAYCNLPNVYDAYAEDCCPCELGLDYGDAPAPYHTLYTDNGARHVVDPAVFVNLAADIDADGQPDPDALGDDNDGNDDEQCDVLMGIPTQGEPTYMLIEASVDGYLDGWIDFFHDGSWAQPIDRVFTSEFLTAGWNLVSFITPVPATPGNTFMRLRFSLNGGLLPTGLAPDGEVEDFAVEIQEAEKFKWVQLPDPDVTGIDVKACSGFVLADDYECRFPGKITEIDIWGSWLGDILPPGGAESAYFQIAIHEDIPATPTSHSMPGDVLWTMDFPTGTFTARMFMPYIEEGWMEPPESYTPAADWTMWLYTFVIPPVEAFHQYGTPGNPFVFWVSLQVDPVGGGEFGWKTSRRHWNDDAVWGIGGVPHPGPWEELIYPPDHIWAGESIDLAFGLRMTSGTGVSDGEVGDSSLLRQNVPNPFNPMTVIEYVLPADGHVVLEVFDAAGHLVRRLVDETQDEGEQVVTWDGRNDEGQPMASGVYFYRLRTASEEVTRSMVILK